MKISPEDVNRMFPVVEVNYYGKGVVQVKRESLVGSDGNAGGGGKGRISYLSSRSRSYLAFAVAATEIKFASLLTLTYGEPYPKSGAVCKRHLNTFMTYMRAAYKGVSYVWVIEFQKRGALHFHILLSVGAIDCWIREQAALRWAHITTPSGWKTGASEETDDKYRSESFRVHAHKKTWENLREEEGAVRYMTKYCLKSEQKRVPEEFQDVGRFFGMSRDVVRCIRKPITLTVDTEGLQLLLEVEGHVTSKWGVSPKYLFGVILEPEGKAS